MLYNVHEKYVTEDAVLAKIIDPEKTNPEKLGKFVALLKLKQDKSIPRTQNDLLISYCQWIYADNRQRRMIFGDEQNLNAVNSTDCADKNISDHLSDELIATAINAGDPTYFSDDAANGLIYDINAGNSTDCADILISNDASDGLIATAIDFVNSTDYAEDTVGGFIDAINTGKSMDCADSTVSDAASDGFIAITIISGNLLDCSGG